MNPKQCSHTPFTFLFFHKTCNIPGSPTSSSSVQSVKRWNCASSRGTFTSLPSHAVLIQGASTWTSAQPYPPSTQSYKSAGILQKSLINSLVCVRQTFQYNSVSCNICICVFDLKHVLWIFLFLCSIFPEVPYYLHKNQKQQFVMVETCVHHGHLRSFSCSITPLLLLWYCQMIQLEAFFV